MLLQTLVSEFLFECEIREYSQLTVKNYQKQLKHFLQFLSSEFDIDTLEMLEPKHIKAFIKYYQMRQCKPSEQGCYCPCSFHINCVCPSIALSIRSGSIYRNKVNTN